MDERILQKFLEVGHIVRHRNEGVKLEGAGGGPVSEEPLVGTLLLGGPTGGPLGDKGPRVEGGVNGSVGMQIS